MEIPLHPIHRLASWNRYLRSLRVLGFLPANLIVLALLVLMTGIAVGEAVASYRNDPEPRPVSLERIFAATPMTNRHVEVTGMIFPEANLANHRTRRGLLGPVRDVHVAMLAEGGNEVLLVKFPGDLGHGEPRLVTVAGLLVPPDARLLATLAERGWTLAGLPVEKRFVLIAGMTPRPVWIYATLAAVAAAFTLAFLLAMRAGTTPPPDQSPGAKTDVRCADPDRRRPDGPETRGRGEQP